MQWLFLWLLLLFGELFELLLYFNLVGLHGLKLLLQSLRYLLMAVGELVLSILVKSERLSRDKWLVDAMSLPAFDLVHHLKFDVTRRYVIAKSDAFNTLDVLTCPVHTFEAACLIDRLGFSQKGIID